MKINKCVPAFFLFLNLIGCKKEDNAATKPVEFKETTYKTLGTIDDTGKPNYLTTKDPISSELLAFLSDTLPERDVRVHAPELLSSNAKADISITQSSDVFITYVSQGSAGFTNSIAFYTYPTSKPPASTKDIPIITYIFPHAGWGTPLQPGDKVKIGRFEPGTSIGFVLLQNGWDAVNKKLNNKAVHFCSSDVLNPEVDPKLKRHVVLVNYTPENKVLIGFEDLDRTTGECDHDFNDVVIYATVHP